MLLHDDGSIHVYDPKYSPRSGGAVATHGGVAAGSGGVAIRGDVQGGVHLYGRKPEEPIIEAPPDGQLIIYAPHRATVVSRNMDSGLEIRAFFK